MWLSHRKYYALSIVLLFSVEASAENSQEKLGLKEIQRIAKENNMGLQSNKAKAEAIGKQLNAQDYNWYPEAGVIGGGNAAQSSGESEIGPVGYAYLRFTLFDGGVRRLDRDLIEVDRANLELTDEIMAKEIDSIIAYHFYRYAIFSEGLKEIQSVKENLGIIDQLAEKLTKLGSMPKVALNGVKLAREKIGLTETKILEKRNHASGSLTRFISPEVVEKIDTQIEPIPELSAAYSDLPMVSVDVKDSTYRYKNIETRVESSKASWLPKVAVEARYGRIPIMDRYFEEPVQGEVLLTANWNITNALQKRSERHALLKRKSALKMELEYKHSLVKSKAKQLEIELQRHVAHVRQIEAFMVKLKAYFDSLEAEVSRGSVPLSEAKSVLLDYAGQIMELADHRAAMWMAYVELNRLVSKVNMER